MLLLWAVLFTITGAEALPGGNLFGLYVLIISSIVLGLLVNKILRLPALLGKSYPCSYTLKCSHVELLICLKINKNAFKIFLKYLCLIMNDST